MLSTTCGMSLAVTVAVATADDRLFFLRSVDSLFSLFVTVAVLLADDGFTFFNSSDALFSNKTHVVSSSEAFCFS